VWAEDPEDVYARETAPESDERPAHSGEYFVDLPKVRVVRQGHEHDVLGEEIVGLGALTRRPAHEDEFLEARADLADEEEKRSIARDAPSVSILGEVIDRIDIDAEALGYMGLPRRAIQHRICWHLELAFLGHATHPSPLEAW
jgi:hypothetical protein